MPNLIYTHPADNIAGLVVPTSASADPAYKPAFLSDSNPAKPAKLTGTSGAWAWDFGSAKQVDLVAIPHHNFAPGLAVKWQMAAVADFSVLSVDLAFTVPAYDLDGFPPRIWLDVAGLATVGNRTKQYARLNITGINTAPIAVGEIVVASTYRTLGPRNISWPLHRDVRRPVIENETDYGVIALYDLGAKIQKLNAKITTTDAGELQIRQWVEAARNRALPFILIPDPALNDALYVRWSDVTYGSDHEFLDKRTMTLGWAEVSRGLVL